MADDWIIFVDANVYLDFYRQSGESAKRQMAALERHSAKIIVSEQLRMEFLKNRQKVILTAFGNIKRPGKTSVPQILTGSEPVRLLAKSEKESGKRYDQLKARVENLLARPLNYDDVLKSFNRIFKENSEYNLKRPNKKRFEIRSRARKRFYLGYPPRKTNDTSIGDAYHWEWIIECALESPANTHVLIVSRDGDYGSNFSGQSYLNDWLRREFKDRVSSKRQIEFTVKLTDALRRLDELVTAEDEKEEEILLGSRRVSPSEIWKYMQRGAAARLLFPDPEIEAILDGFPDMDDLIADASDATEVEEIDFQVPGEDEV